jgi:hypothetical protein
VIEEDERFGRTAFGRELVSHHQDDVDVVRLRDVGNIAAENHQPVEQARGNRE